MENGEYKILVVDDNTTNIQLLVNLLSEEDYDVEYALNGPDALELISSEDFDLILLDIMMPEMDGFEVCQKIKNNPDKNEIPIIFLTAKTDIESIEKAFNLGGLDYVSKPFNTNELLARVKTHVELKVSKDKLKGINKWLEEKVEERTAELKIANNKLLKMDSAKSQFLSIISHEIRTPLNGILGGVTLIKEFSTSDETKTFIEMLDDSAKRLESFSYKALDISQFNILGKELLTKVETNITQITSNVITDLEDMRERKEIEISHAFNTASENYTIDPDFFYKCIYNILENAIQFSPDNGSVLVDVRTQDDNLVIEIKDEGIGFKEGFTISEIGPFESEDHVDQNPGLGLFLSNLIVKAHGGRIENGNNKEKGAFVKIIIPVDLEIISFR